MSRSLRIEFKGARYHVMGRGVARQHTFRDDHDRRRFLDGLAAQVEAGQLDVLAFCLMGNHYHLLCRTPRAGLARVMRHVNGDYATWFNRRHERVGHLWQGRYKALLVGGPKYLAECSRYIHLNPTRARLVRRPREYRWSSWRNYLGGRPVVDWIETGPVLQEFGKRRAGYRAYMEAGNGEAPVSPFERAVAGVVLGGDAFVARVQRKIAQLQDDGERPALRALTRTVGRSPERVEAAVEATVGAAPSGVGPARQVRLKLYALRRYTTLGSSAIARRHGRSPAAVTLAVRDLDVARRHDRVLARALRDIARRLKTKN